MSNVHPRPRKRPPRCTLDCGFKTPESPALRGFVGGPRALATAALYLVLKSNGLRHSKNLPVKFDFSPIDTSATIAKKLLLQRCSKPHFIAFFNFSHKRPTLAFTGESGYTHSPLPTGSHTAAYTPKQGLFRTGALPSDRSARFGNPAWPGGRAANFAVFGSWPGVLPKNAKSLRDSDALMRVAVPRRRGPAGLRDLFSFLSKLQFSHSVLRAFRVCETWEVALPSACFACCRNAGWPLVKAANLPFSEVG